MKDFLRNARHNVRPARKEFYLTILLSVLNVLCDSYYPFLVQRLIDHASNLQGENILFAIASFVISVILTIFVQYENKIMKNRYERKIMTTLRQDGFQAVLAMPYEDFHSQKIEEYSSILLNDLEDLYRSYYENLIYLIDSLVMLAVYTVVLLFHSWQMCLVIMGTLIFTFVVPKFAGKHFDAYNNSFAESRSNYLAVLEESFKAHDIYDRNSRDRIQKRGGLPSKGAPGR